MQEPIAASAAQSYSAPMNDSAARRTAPRTAAAFKRRQASLPLRQRLKRFCRSLPFVVSSIYFLFLLCVGITITTTTRVRTGLVLHQTWSATHATQVRTVESVITDVVEHMHQLTVAAASMFTQSPIPVESNMTLTMLCAQLAMSDKAYRLRVLAIGSFAVVQYASCTHGDWADPDPSNMTAMMSDKDHFYGVYFINPATYTYYDPPILKGALNTSTPASETINKFVSLFPLLTELEAFLNGTIPSIPDSDLWTAPVSQPNYIYHTLPITLLGIVSSNNTYTHPTDFVQTRIDGGMLLNTSLLTNPYVHMRAMALVAQSLGREEPQVLSNNWGQPVVRDAAFSVVVDTGTTYLTARDITDPLMQAALRYIDLAAMKDPSYRKTHVFSYRGAPAVITAWTYTHHFGLSVPMVVVSPQYYLTGPYTTIFDVCTIMVALAVVLITALCYFAIDRYVARPLRRLTAAMLASVQRGARQPVRADPCDVLQLTETRELTRAYNTAMAQLRAVDEFVPDALRAGRRDTLVSTSSADGNDSARSNPVRPSQRLRQHYLTIVTVRITPAAAAAARGGGVDTDALLRRHAADTGRGRFAELVNAVAGAQTRMACSGPFRGPAALAAFVTAVRELCDAHHGTVHRVAPDRCVLHFARSVRAALARQPAPADSEAAAAAAQDARMERSATADARAAVAFALCLQEWVAERAAEADAAAAAAGGAAGGGMPDVRVLVDTGLFTCGQYCASALQQTLSVALGRDAERAVGHVAAQLGVRVALTEETAVRVRGTPSGSEKFSVRQLPVEALHTGRAGLDAAVIILYEALPGRVAGDTAWQLYTRSCFDAFGHMVRGDYPAALSRLKDVAEISDLEPGLLPRSLSREAASSSAVGGAVSTQVARLISECERRIARGCTEGFQRYRRVPLGVDALLPSLVGSLNCSVATRRDATALGSSAAHADRDARGASLSGRGHLRGVVAPVPMGHGVSQWRYVVNVNTTKGTVQCVLGGRPDWIRDNYGLFWYLPKAQDHARAAANWQRTYTALGSAGTLCTVTTLALRMVDRRSVKVLEDAPAGVVWGCTETVMPVSRVSAGTRAKVHKLFRTQISDRHPNLLHPIAYSFSVDGCVTVLWEYSPSGTMRDVVDRYPLLSPVIINRFSVSVLGALCHLHANNIAHGFLSLDSVHVGADGVCQLMKGYTDFKADHEVFVLPATCYISPVMARGEPPTPACDMFCYGLMCLEATTRRPAWTWAPTSNSSSSSNENSNNEPQPSEEELMQLLTAGGKAFCEAVTSGRVVPDTSAIDSLTITDRWGAEARELEKRLLSYDPSQRPTSLELFEFTKERLIESGIQVRDSDMPESSETSESPPRWKATAHK